MMKRRLLVAAAVLAMLALFAAVALVRLANRSLAGSRQQFESQLTARLGRPVHVGRVGVGWRGGLGIDLDDVVVDESAAPGASPIVRAASVGLTVAFWPLFTDRELAFDVTVRQPEFQFVRSTSGVWNYAGLGRPDAGAPPAKAQVPATPPAPPTPGAASAPGAAIAVVLREARIVAGSAEIRDLAATPPRNHRLTEIDVTVQDVGTLAPTRFSVAAAIDAATRNLSLDGTAGPFFDAARIPVDVRGRIGPLGAQGLTIDDLRGKATWTPAAVEIDTLDGRTFGGTVHASGTVPIDSRTPIALTTTFTALDLARLAPLADPALSGRLSGAVDGHADLHFRADSVRTLRASVTGSAELHARDAVLHRFNIATEVVDDISDVPGLGDLVSARTRSKYTHLFNTSATRVSRADTTMRVADESVTLDHCTVSAPQFSLDATGTVTFDLIADLSGVLSLSAPVSADIANDVKLAAVLRDENGEMSLPWTLRGRLGQALPQAETAAIARLVARGVGRNAPADVLNPVVRGLDRAGPIGQALKGLLGR